MMAAFKARIGAGIHGRPAGRPPAWPFYDPCPPQTITRVILAEMLASESEKSVQ
jgi:hypothetical protein